MMQTIRTVMLPIISPLLAFSLLDFCLCDSWSPELNIKDKGTVDGPDSRRAVCICWSCRCIARYPEMTGNPYRPAAATTTKHKETQKKDGYESRCVPYQAAFILILVLCGGLRFHSGPTT
ncbi:unnamed protein product [Boreogadus saida]